MAVTPARLVSGSQLTTSAVSYYTSTNAMTRIDACALTNTSGGTVTVTVHLVPSGDTAGSGNCVMKARSLTSGQTVLVSGAIGQWIDTNGSLQALASSGGAITLVASGVVYA